MTIFDNVFPLGLGTNRFPITGVDDEDGIRQSVDIVVRALSAGVNYIDCSHTNSRGMVHRVLQSALRHFPGFEGVTIKTRLDLDGNSDAVRRRAENTLSNIGIERAKYFCFWTIFSYAEFLMIMQPGGPYEGALKLKDEGLIDHICFSTHAPVDDIVKIMQSQAFEAVTISFSLLNSLRMQNVLEKAHTLHIGVAVMNPLGGGIIPSNLDFFAFAKSPDDTTVAEAAMRYVLAHKDIQIALSGVSSCAELEQNLRTLQRSSSETDEQRIARVNKHITALDNFCVGCNYCRDCPQKIPIPAIMQCRNSLLFTPSDATWAAASPTVRENIYVVGKLEQDFSILFETAENPCVRCGQCETICTQHLPIMDAVADTFDRVDYTRQSRQARVKKLKTLIDNTPGVTIGLYPSGLNSLAVLTFYRENIGDLKCQFVQFDSNPRAWGKTDNGIGIYAPQDIPTIRPASVLITAYKFRDEIYDTIKQYASEGIKIAKLQEDNELPWFL